MAAENISHYYLECSLCMMVIVKNQILTIIQMLFSSAMLYSPALNQEIS